MMFTTRSSPTTRLDSMAGGRVWTAHRLRHLTVLSTPPTGKTLLLSPEWACYNTPGLGACPKAGLAGSAGGVRACGRTATGEGPHDAHAAVSRGGWP